MAAQTQRVSYKLLAAFLLFTIGTSDTREVEKLLKSHSIGQITTVCY